MRGVSLVSDWGGQGGTILLPDRTGRTLVKAARLAPGKEFSMSRATRSEVCPFVGTYIKIKLERLEFQPCREGQDLEM